MAFGNPNTPNALAHIPAFRAAHGAFANEAKNPDTVKPREVPEWKKAYYPVVLKGDATDVYDVIRIIPGDYTMKYLDDKDVVQTLEHQWYLSNVMHYDKDTKAKFLCSGGVYHEFANRREPCEGCAKYDKEGLEQNYEWNRMSMGKYRNFSISILEYGTFALLPDTDEKGLVRKSPEGAVYESWVKMKPRDKRIKDHKTTQGMAKFWDMPKAQWGQLNSVIASNVGRTCVQCQRKGQLDTMAWVCPACGEPEIDMQSTHLADEEIAAVVGVPQVCRHCGHMGYLGEVLACNSGCSDPRRANIFEVDLHIGVQESNNKSKSKTLVLADYTFNPIPDEYKHLVPLDLEQVKKVDTIPWQQYKLKMRKDPPTSTVETKAYSR